MATQGKPALSRGLHERLLEAWQCGNSQIYLAALFGLTLPTVRRYLALEPGSPECPYERAARRKEGGGGAPGTTPKPLLHSPDGGVRHAGNDTPAALGCATPGNTE